jgi:hypothetical protein
VTRGRCLFFCAFLRGGHQSNIFTIFAHSVVDLQRYYLWKDQVQLQSIVLQLDFQVNILSFFLSAVAYLSASANISSTSVSFKLDAPLNCYWLLYTCLFSRAFTDRIPSTSISNVTSIWNTTIRIPEFHLVEIS